MTLNLPNMLTLLRLVAAPGVPLMFLYFSRPFADFAALALFIIAAVTDWFDGYLARRLGQVSEFGRKFDPTVDRLLFIVALVAIIIDGAAPIWFCVAVLVRELLVGGTIAIATVFFGMARFDVTFWGKLATFLLMFAIPGFMLGWSDFPLHTLFAIGAWLLGIPGLVLSYYTAITYVPKIREVVRAGRDERSPITAHPPKESTR